MNNQIREPSPTKQPHSERTNASSIHVEMELGDEQLSKVSAGRLTCANGRHFNDAKIIC